MNNTNWLSLGRRDIYILPTRIGWYYCLVLIALFGIAAKFDNQAAYLMLFLLVAISLITMFISNQNLKGIQCLTQVQANGFVNDNIQYTVKLKITKKTQANALFLYHDGQYSCIDKGENTNNTLQTVFTQEASTRGYLPTPVIKLASNYPLGLFICWSKALPVQHPCLIYPNAHHHLLNYIDEQAIQTNPFDNNNQESELDSLQPYKQGDTMRDIHWASFAKTHKLVSKKFIYMSHDDQMFHFDNLPNILSYEEKLNQLCFWLLQAQQQSRHYQLILPNNSLGPNQGVVFLHQCLSQLALMPKQQTPKER